MVALPSAFCVTGHLLAIGGTMAAPREPRRVIRSGWEVSTHLGELDSDIDEIHAMRAQDRLDHVELVTALEHKHNADVKRIETKLDKLITTAVTATIAGFSAAATLAANLAWKFFDF